MTRQDRDPIFGSEVMEKLKEQVREYGSIVPVFDLLVMTTGYIISDEWTVSLNL